MGARPSRITTARTPPSIALRAVSVLGIIPPAITPEVVNSRIFSGVSSVRTSPSAFLTPETSVSSKSRSAFSAAAIAPATVSPLILNVSPLSPAPKGAITGIISASKSLLSTVGSMSRGLPTNPSFGSAGSQMIKFASLPDKPTARPPCALIACTMRLLTRPDKTISTTSIVASSVTRLPSTNLDLISSRSSISLIIGPPPCTMTGFTPTCCIKTMSRAKVSIASSLPMAWPPNLITTVAPS